MLKKMIVVATLLPCCLFLFAGSAQAAANGKVKIGFSMDTLKEERWQKDRDLFTKKVKDLGAEVLVQAANGNDNLQLSQSENLLTQGVDVLVIAPHNAKTAAAIVRLAHKAGKKIICYDRLIQNSEPDLYISFDNFEVGKLQGQYALNHTPKGNYLIINGAPTDYNAKLYHDGQMSVLKPAADKGDIKIVGDQWAHDWLASEALKHTENALTKNNNNIQAVVAANDGTAGGVVSALSQQNLAGKVLVTGQDADLAACQRVVEGTQAMTVYKPIKTLADTAAEIAVKMAKGEMPKTTKTVNNGTKDIPSILLTPIVVDKGNMEKTVIADGYHTDAQVFKNVANRK